MVIRSSDSLQFYPSNNANRFIIQLDEEIVLNGLWEIGLVEFSISRSLKPGQDVYIYSDICGNSIVGGSRSRLLRRCFLKRGENNAVFSNPMYISVISKHFHCIELYLTLSDGRPIPFATNTVVTITLHFKKHSLL